MADIKKVAEELLNLTAEEVESLNSELKTLGSRMTITPPDNPIKIPPIGGGFPGDLPPIGGGNTGGNDNGNDNGSGEDSGGSDNSDDLEDGSTKP